MPTSPVPEGYHTVTPYLIVKGVPALIRFMQEALDARVLDRVDRPDGGVMHARLQVGDSSVMMGEASDTWPAMPAGLYLYVAEVDATHRRAVAAGGTSVMDPADQFYGDRMSGVKDPTGNLWWIATRKEDVPPEEMQRRAAAAEK